MSSSPAVDKIDPARKLELVRDFWSPKAIGALNDFLVKVVKLQGEFVWHSHEKEDELFYVLRGTLRMQFRDGEVALGVGELIIVPHGVEHRPVADEEVHVLLLEPGTTVNTGTAGGERTRDVEWI
jgi:mannose-6-phosphate isomerase-like protein (cupin superfamily)